MNKDKLKELLIKIKESDFKVPSGIDPKELCKTTLPLLVSQDMELRDRLIYSTLANWIINDVLSYEFIADMADTLVSDEYLFYRINSNDESAVVKRTFSVLLLAPIVYKHRMKNILRKDLLDRIKDAVVCYAENEKDVTGYKETYGWAHSVAHTADTIDELVQCREFSNDDLIALFNSVKTLLLKSDRTYVSAEDERLAFAVASLFKTKRLDTATVVKLVLSLVNEHKRDFSNIAVVYKDINIRSFMRCLTMYISDKHIDQEIRDCIEKKTKELMRIDGD